MNLHILVRILIISTLGIASCGGGGSSSSIGTSNSDPFLQFSGTVAIGAPLSSVMVTASCANNKTVISTPTNANGNYTLSLNAQLPCILSAIEPQSGYKFRAISDTSGTVNVTPLTEAIFVFSSGDTKNLIQAIDKLKFIMKAINNPIVGNPISTSFIANGTGHDAVIQGFVKNFASTTLDPSSINYTNLSSRLSEFNICNINYGCIDNTVLLSQINTDISRKFLSNLFDQIDSGLFNIPGTIYSDSLVKIFQGELLNRIIKYSLVIATQRLGDSVVKDFTSSISKSIAKKFRDSLALPTPDSVINLSQADLIEFVVGAVVHAYIETLEEQYFPTLGGDGFWMWSGSEWGKAIAWGSLSYTGEVIV